MTNEQHIENLKKLKSFHNGSYGADIDRAIQALEQEPKTGHWIMHEKYRECSKCTVWLPKDMPRNSFCPNCGAKMVEPQESEE